MRQTTPAQEITFRRERYERQLRPIHAEFSGEDPVEVEAARQPARNEILPVITDFVEERRSAEELRAAIQDWSHDKPSFGFSGAMTLNQAVKDAEAGTAETHLRAALRIPADRAAAARQLAALADWFIELRREGSGVSTARAPFFASWFWWMQDPSTWRPMWVHAKNTLTTFGWLDEDPEHPGDWFAAYTDVIASLGTDPIEVETVLSWYGIEANQARLGIDPTITARNTWALGLEHSKTPNSSAQALEQWHARLANAEQLLGELTQAAKLLQPTIDEALGTPTNTRTASPNWVNNDERTTVRNDEYVQFRPVDAGKASPSIRLFVDAHRVVLSLHTNPNSNRKGFSEELHELLGNDIPAGVTPYRQVWEPGSSMLVEDATNWSDLAVDLDPARIARFEDLAEQVARALDLLDEPYRRARAELGDTPVTTTGPLDDTDVAGLVEAFRTATHYPTERDLERAASRDELAALFQRNRLPRLDRAELRKIGGSLYGSPGTQANLYRTIRDADDEMMTKIAETLDFLLYDGATELAERITTVLDHTSDRSIPGLGETVVMKLLAVTRPGEFIPVYPYGGDKGKAAALERLGCPVPEMALSVGERHVRANRTLRDLLEPYFPGDPWGQMRFCYWALEDHPEPDVEGDEPDDDGTTAIIERLSEIAPEVYLPVDYLTELYRQLAQAQQVIFSGPPGTGKTLIAQRLAEAIAPGDDQRMLVQFHPSYGYEDFVEGFRPVASADGQLTYRIEPGPLRTMADRALDDPRNTYVLIIDEINRANLPKVFGELLFLLEYRDRSARLMYHPDEDFTLPSNLWIIGTMNTADRSVALIDAAMRRRFRFIDFTPDVDGERPIANVLAKWVEAEGQLDVLPSFVDAVNNRLAHELGGRHLVLGPSYFMRRNIDEAMLREIWEYQIRPLVEDLFFGDAETQKRFDFDMIWQAIVGSPTRTDDTIVTDPADDAL